MKQLLSTGDVSKLLGIAKHKIEYAIANGSIPEPELRIANKRVFTSDDVQRVANHFGVELKIEEGA